ncbi:MAG: DUF4835 family protein [Bacteroidales bacterium]
MFKGIIITILSLLLFNLKGQEFICSVEVNSQQIQTSDRRVFETLRSAMYEFMNNQSFTNYKYQYYERLECSMLWTILEQPAGNIYKCELTIALRRPVFNSTYNTILFNYIDRDIEINYIENQPLDFNQGMFSSNLTSVLAYYAYVMLGLDFDSFSRLGGNPYFEAAQQVVNNAQNYEYRGWKSSESTRNRFWLLENITNPSYVGIRNFYYEYHLQGLDVMFETPEKGRKVILETLKYIQQIKKSRPNLLFLQIIADSKRDELVNVFSEGTTSEKNDAYNLLREIDPANTMTYQKILQN